MMDWFWIILILGILAAVALSAWCLSIVMKAMWKAMREWEYEEDR